MLAGQFEQKLRKLNSRIRICCLDNNSRAAGVYQIRTDGEYEEICGTDKHYLPEHTVFNKDTSIRLGGWRRVLRILIQKGLIDRRKAEKLFGTSLMYRITQKPKVHLPTLKNIEAKWR